MDVVWEARHERVDEVIPRLFDSDRGGFSWSVPLGILAISLPRPSAL